jgi:succinoglycan biosynthesis transport protein ExoP
MDAMEQNPQTQEFAPEKEGSIWSSLTFAWRRKGLVILSLMIGAGLGYMHFLKQDPIYKSSTQVMIVEERPRLPINGVELEKSSEEMHVTMMRGQAVISKAITDGKLDRLSPVSLSIVGGGNRQGAIIQLSYESHDPDECPKVLNAVVKAYEQILDEMYQDVSKETVELIGRAKDQLETQIADIEKNFRKMLDESPLLVTGETAHNIHEVRLVSIEGVRSAAVVENAKLQAKIDALHKSLALGGRREALNLLVGHIESFAATSQIADTRDQLFPLLLEQEMLLERRGKDHPEAVALAKRIAFVRNHLGMDEPETDVVDDKPVEADYFEIYLESLAEQIKMNQQTVTEMTTLFEVEREAAKLISKYQVEEELFRSELDRKSRLFDVVLKRLEEINLVESRAGAKIETIHPPHRGRQSQANLRTIMMQFSVVSMLVGLGLAFVVDSADRRFRSPAEIRSELGVPVVGHIPIIRPEKKAKKKANQEQEGTVLAHELRTVHAPLGRVAEAYRAVRTAIYFSARGGGHKVIQVTSPTPGDGKSTLAANLAVSIATSGKRVLLLEADFRRPRVHKIFGLSNEIGMTAVIEDSVDWLDAVQTTSVDNLNVMTCGKRPRQPSELLTSKRFEELLDLFREQFDLVIIDTPPVGAVTDPLNVAPRVDGVLVVLRLSKSARNSARRSLEALEEVGGNVIGIVVNGVEQGQEGNYGYNNYGSDYAYQYGSGYGYGRGYGYGKRYGYHYGDKGSYYADDKTAEKTEVAVHKTNGKH